MHIPPCQMKDILHFMKDWKEDSDYNLQDLLTDEEDEDKGGWSKCYIYSWIGPGRQDHKPDSSSSDAVALSSVPTQHCDTVVNILFPRWLQNKWLNYLQELHPNQETLLLA